jgi:hypothetical protein
MDALRNLADGILADARMAGAYWGDRKVFLASIPGVDVCDPEWCQLLDELRRLGLLEFARADLVAAMDSDLVARSEWSQGGATNHFLVVA